ncbi:anthranilate synthase component I family protein [Sesbania bispinosa]|nr:anthranilate synthase component I family protein [Sesbania bispinosa]
MSSRSLCSHSSPLEATPLLRVVPMPLTLLAHSSITPPIPPLPVKQRKIRQGSIQYFGLV